MTVEREILKYLSESKNNLRYKGIRVGFLGLPDFEHYKYQTLANNASLLQKKGFIKRIPSGDFIITLKGREFLEKREGYMKKFETEQNENSPKSLLIIYDIPQDKKKERDWFRFHLKKFHFVMIQKSVWVGPSPLPKEFLRYVREIGLKDNFKTFKLANGYGKK